MADMELGELRLSSSEPFFLFAVHSIRWQQYWNRDVIC